MPGAFFKLSFGAAFFVTFVMIIEAHYIPVQYRCMAEKILFVKSAFKHGYTKNDIEQAIETKIFEDILVGEDDIYVIIGFNTVANPIEVFYNIIDENTIKVFHAMPLRDKVAAQMNKE